MRECLELVRSETDLILDNDVVCRTCSALKCVVRLQIEVEENLAGNGSVYDRAGQWVGGV
jgi:hypothetical protein